MIRYLVNDPSISAQFLSYVVGVQGEGCALLGV